MYKIQNAELKQLIEEQLINPYIAAEIKRLAKTKEIWRRVANISEIIGYVFMMTSTILAFTSGVYSDNVILSYVAGCINIISLAILKFSNYAHSESSDRNDSLNILLSRLNILSLPNVSLTHNTQLNTTPIAFY